MIATKVTADARTSSIRLNFTNDHPSFREEAQLRTAYLSTQTDACVFIGQKEACSQNDNFDLYTPCTFSRVYIAHRVLAYIGLGMYMCYHLWYLRVGRSHHSIVPYSSFALLL